MKKLNCNWKFGWRSPFEKCKFTCVSTPQVEDSCSVASIPNSDEMYPQVNVTGDKDETSSEETREKMLTNEDQNLRLSNNLSPPTSLPSPNAIKNSVVKSIKKIQLGNVSTSKKDTKVTTQASSSSKKAIRNKVSLKPGRSLMDWIRLGSSGKDLTGVGGKFLDVTKEELKKHNKRGDAWLSIKGIVYNVSHYGEFHPGGVEELEKGFGKDATKLFMDAHSWVNFESMLQKCVVGRLVSHLVPPIVEVEPQVNQKKPNMQIQNDVNSDNDQKSLSCDWHQSNEKIVIELITKWPDMKSENIIIDIVEKKELIITIYLENSISYIHLDLEQSISPESEVRVLANGKVDIVLNKVKFTKWNSLGKTLALHNKSTAKEQTIPRYRACKLIRKTKMNFNTFLFTFELNEGCRMKIPIASHVWLKIKTNGVELQRSYSPIPSDFLNLQNRSDNGGRNLYFLIKIYPDGKLTPLIDKLEIEDIMDISDHFSSFKLSTSFTSCGQLVLLSAGTGVTPILSILHHLLLEDAKRDVKICLLFFNKSEDDILCRDELESLGNRDERFSVSFVLTQPSPEWKGLCGHISTLLLEDLLVSSISKEKHFFCVCGPTLFDQVCLRLLRDLGYDDAQVHVFPNN